MRASRLYRVMSIVLGLFALGHTAGFLRFRPASAQALAVRQAMDDVRFTVRGSSFSYGEFYVGFGLFVTVYLVFAAIVAWQLGSLTRDQTAALGPLRWAFLGVQVATVVLSAAYFSAPPIVFSIVVTMLAASAMWLERAERPQLVAARA